MLSRFERLMEEAVEGSLGRVFSTSLQPIQMAKAAARAMEQAQIIGLRGPQVPNLYEVRLAPADLARFGEYQHVLLDDLRTYLREYAGDRRLRPVAEITVELVEDASVRAGSVRASARFAGLSAAVEREVEAAVDGTRQLRLADLAAARGVQTQPGTAPLVLTDGRSLEFTLEPEMDVVRLGRALDNDVVIESTRVSRYHVQLRWVESSWLVYDLDSTNGTWVDEQRLEPGIPGRLNIGTRFRLGDYALHTRRA